MDFFTPDFGKAPRDDTTFNRKRMRHKLCIETQSFVYFGHVPQQQLVANTVDG
jgi:hypothetical protein